MIASDLPPSHFVANTYYVTPVHTRDFGPMHMKDFGDNLKSVIAFTGRRDNYEGVRALAESGHLAGFATDVYFQPAIAKGLTTLTRKNFMLRTIYGLDHRLVSCSPISAFCSAASMISPALRRRLIPTKDAAVSLLGAKLAARDDVGLLAYSYYAGAGFARYGHKIRSKIIFQVHPNAAFLRKLYYSDMANFPEFAASLRQEDEILYENSRFQKENDLAPQIADGVICASSFTRKSMIEAGVMCPIEVVPYGVDADAIEPQRYFDKSRSQLIVAFIGQVTQRKGFGHLLQALKLCRNHVRLRVFSRTGIPSEFDSSMRCIDVEVIQNLPNYRLIQSLKQCDLLMLPSLAEGFGLVILEAMAAGVPVCASAHSGGFDVISDYKDGFVVNAGAIDEIFRVVEYGIRDRNRLFEMGYAARATAERFTWDNYRRSFVRSYLRLANESRSQHGTP